MADIAILVTTLASLDNLPPVLSAYVDEHTKTPWQQRRAATLPSLASVSDYVSTDASSALEVVQELFTVALKDVFGEDVRLPLPTIGL